MRVFYSPFYYADIGQRHVFPIRKLELVRDRLLAVMSGRYGSDINDTIETHCNTLRAVHTIYEARSLASW